MPDTSEPECPTSPTGRHMWHVRNVHDGSGFFLYANATCCQCGQALRLEGHAAREPCGPYAPR